MIAFGASITSPQAYDLQAGPGIARVAEPGALVMPYQAGESVTRVYNLMLDHAAARDDLEALVLVHQDAELVDPGLPARVRALLADGTVGLAGVLGSTGAGSMAWWDGEVRWTGLAYRYGHDGGGELDRWPATPPATPAPLHDGDVDQLYGIVLVLSPWAVRTLRFDESLPAVHGHDHDLSRQVLAAGKRVVTAPLGIVHHHALQLVANPDAWAIAHRRVSAKWDDEAPAGDDAAWIGRARRAEASTGAWQLFVNGRQLQDDARHARERREHEQIATTGSWRATRRLRELSERARARSGDRPD